MNKQDFLDKWKKGSDFESDLNRVVQYEVKLLTQFNQGKVFEIKGEEIFGQNQLLQKWNLQNDPDFKSDLCKLIEDQKRSKYILKSKGSSKSLFGEYLKIKGNPFEHTPLISPELDIDASTLGEYLIGLEIVDLLNIDSQEQSLSIKEEEGNDYLAKVDILKMSEWERIKAKSTNLELDKKKMFGKFDPEKPLRVKLDYPLGDEFEFEIMPYTDSQFSYYPVGYVAWNIAKLYEKVYQEPKNYGIYGHGIEDLYLDSIFLYPDNCIEIDVLS